MIVLEQEWPYKPLPNHILTIGQFADTAYGLVVFSAGPTFLAFNWGTANLARYRPLTLPQRFTVARFMTPNGNATGNVDMGLYDFAGNRLISTGSTARVGTNAMQYINVTNQSFPPGLYYLAMVCSSTTSQVMRTGMDETPHMQMSGALQEALGSTVLPATMTPAGPTPATDLPVWGFTQSDTL